MAYTLSYLLTILVKQRGEAVHLHEGESPVLEVKRFLRRVEGARLEPGDTYALLAIFALEDDLLQFQNNGLVCFYHRFRESIVFQFMAFRENGHIRLEIRKLK